jgi:glycopeptide antibiotics resistance protein
MIEEYYWKIRWFFMEQMSGVSMRGLFIIMVYSAAFTLLPGYILHVKKGVSIKRVVLSFFTVLYAGIMLFITIFRRPIGSRPGEIHTYLNLGITFDGVYSSMEMIYSFFNFVLFFIWGILTGLFRTEQKPLRIVLMTTLIGFITSFSIELLQLVTRTGQFELTDLVTNVAGAFAGALFVAMGVILFKGKTNNEEQTQ